ncbi:(2Fe-2S)-binding protein [Streptomyces sp.]|uniref:(2Fe-2S)-binding protein n=1 Tax=Streptomyces sp. TaxID=1931 RepID=UPI002F3F2EBB
MTGSATDGSGGGGCAPAAWQSGLAALGPFFAVRTHDAGRPAAPPWRSMAELRTDPSVLRERVAAVRGALASGGGRPPRDVEARVAASVAHLGVVARLVSPCLALAVLYGEVPYGLRLAALRWQPALGGPYPLSLPARPAIAGTDDAGSGPDELADALTREVCDGPVRELGEEFAALRVSPRIAWGNVASAVNGAAGMIAAARPDRAARARTVAALVLDRPPLRGTATRTSTGAFQRRSCCLIYRAAPGRAGALCGDCVLRR